MQPDDDPHPPRSQHRVENTLFIVAGLIVGIPFFAYFIVLIALMVWAIVQAAMGAG